MKIVAIVVIYNKKCSESISIEGLHKYGKDIDVVVFDNSAMDFGNEQYCKKIGYKYYTKKKNMGLSKAYNYVIGRISCDYVMILDDDTKLNKKYFDEIERVTSGSRYDIILPIVKAGGMIISPSMVQFGCRVIRIKAVDEVDMKRITAINSGMVVKRSVYDKVKYDESIFLDYVDHDFMRKVRKAQLNIKVLDVYISQNFSMIEKKDLASERRRAEIYRRDLRLYYKKCRRPFLYYVSIWKYDRRLKKKLGCSEEEIL